MPERLKRNEPDEFIMSRHYDGGYNGRSRRSHRWGSRYLNKRRRQWERRETERLREQGELDMTT